MKIFGRFGFLLGTLALSCWLSPVAGAYEETAVTNGGTLKGKVTYSGVVPTRKIVPTKDPEVCGGVQDVPLIKVGSGNGVEEAVLLLQEVKKGKAWEKSEPKVPVLDNKKCTFEPHVQVVAADSSIGIHNSDPVLHNTHGFLDNKTVFNVALPLQGMEIKKSLKKPGLVRIDCDAHGWMRGWIYVVDNPYYAVTGEKGDYEITKIPPGTYTLKIWQEEKGITERQITVAAGKTVMLDIELK